MHETNIFGLDTVIKLQILALVADFFLSTLVEFAKSSIVSEKISKQGNQVSPNNFHYGKRRHYIELLYYIEIL